MMKTASLIAISGSLLLGSSVGFADDEVSQELNLDLDGITKLVVIAGPGDLELVGQEGRGGINVQAAIKNESGADYVLRLEREGNRAVLEAKFEDNIRSGAHYIDLEISADANLELDVRDGSGDTAIRNMNEGLDINDGSGDLEIVNVKGKVDVNDGSGDLALKDIEGDLDINDGSGEVEVSGLLGDLDIHDGSGEIEITDVTGNVDVFDGSGDIEVNQVTGLVTVGDGSGDIEVAQAGDFELRRDGSGKVRLDGVRIEKD